MRNSSGVATVVVSGSSLLRFSRCRGGVVDDDRISARNPLRRLRPRRAIDDDRRQEERGLPVENATTMIAEANEARWEGRYYAISRLHSRSPPNFISLLLFIMTSPSGGSSNNINATAMAANEEVDKYEIMKRTANTTIDAMKKVDEIEKKHRIISKTKTLIVDAATKAKEIDNEYHIVSKTKDATASAVKKAREIDAEYHIVDKSKETAANTARTAKEIDEKHRVVENTRKHAISAMHMAKEINEKHQVTAKLMNVAKLTIKSISKATTTTSSSSTGSSTSVDDKTSKKEEEDTGSTKNNGSHN